MSEDAPGHEVDTQRPIFPATPLAAPFVVRLDTAVKLDFLARYLPNDIYDLGKGPILAVGSDRKCHIVREGDFFIFTLEEDPGLIDIWAERNVISIEDAPGHTVWEKDRALSAAA